MKVENHLSWEISCSRCKAKILPHFAHECSSKGEPATSYALPEKEPQPLQKKDDALNKPR